MHSPALRSRVVGLLALLVFLIAAPSAGARRPGASGEHHKDVCGQASAGHAKCAAEVVTEAATGDAVAQVTPFGYGPADLQSAYSLPSATGGAGQTIAIVDAYNDPNAESDLATYRAQYGLSPCTTANGCFKKVNQTGGTSYPASDSGWGQEISLDVDMASATCPNCHILLVEASSNSFANLGVAEDYAAAHATVVSNSYGGSEFSGETSPSNDSHYTHPGVPITVSSGDNGYGVEYPAASSHVTAVGGTSLNRATSTARGWTETAWSGAGSGCSAYVPKPAWQHDSSCARRTVADVSAVADPNTGVAVYDTYGSGGWLVFGGTSVAAPVIAGTYALIGNAGSTADGSYFYGFPSNIFDVLSGSNGSCSGSYLCTAGPGYDGPTGLGTPNLGISSPPPVGVAPVVATGSASVITTSGATLGATVNPSGQATTYHFDYGQTASYGSSTTSANAGSGSSAQSVSAVLSGLTPSTTYHFRIVATNATGTSNGSDGSFTTAAAPTGGTASPGSVVVSSGSISSGSAASLGAADGSSLSVLSTSSRTPVASWYGVMSGVVPNSLHGLTATYAGKSTASCTQVISIYNFSTGSWKTLDTRTAGTSLSTATIGVTGTLASYVSGSTGNGDVRLRVSCTGSSRTRFTDQGDLMQVSWTN